MPLNRFTRQTMVKTAAFFFIFLFTCTLTFSQVKTQAAAASKGTLTIPPFVQAPERKPMFPLKTQRMIFSESDISTAASNIARFPQARAVRDTILKKADKWLEWKDAELRDLLSDARVPRAFDLNPKGCPVHGDQIFKGGFYPWIVDPRAPFRVKCPIGHEMYPSNDFASYYKGDFKSPVDKSIQYTDDGWGWVAPDGERFWFVAYANHWLWMNFIVPAMNDLARAYILTGNKVYAHKAATLLYRMAEVYPSMDHENQSRYGLMSKADNIVYNGKIVNHIWEAALIQDAAEAYDAIWNTIDGDSDLHQLYGKSGEQIRSFIEANLLEEAIDSYYNEKIQGNYGMHQMALQYILLARGHVETAKHLHEMVDEPGKDRAHTGIRFALYNQIFRDGLPYESPDYNLIWVRQLADIGETLKKGGTNLFSDKRLKMLLNGPLEIVTTGLYTPDWGDSGHSLGALKGRNPNAYQIAYKEFKDPRYLDWLGSDHQTGGNTFSTFRSLFRQVLPETQPLPGARGVPVMPSRLFAGYGNGILNNRMDNSALSFTYGMHVSHYHWDFLNFELFANGQKMMPDLGYPDAMNAYVSEVYTWSTNTVAHNTVVVDAQKQKNNHPGVVHDFSDGPFARSMDASSPAYSQTSQYRRNLVMVDVDDNQSYVVDFFHVAGGKQHDYVLHGPPGKISEVTGKWGEIQPGTLAGPNVMPGVLYDDEKLGQKGYSGGYGGYRGSGFQHLFNVQKSETSGPVMQYQHISDPDALLRIHLQEQDQQEVYRADAYDKPRAKTHLLKFMVARRQAKDEKEMKSTFISVLETFKGKPYIQSTRKLPLESGSGQAMEIKRANAVDVVINDTVNTLKKLKMYGVETDANSAVLTFNEQKQLIRAFFSNGTFLKCNGKNFTVQNTKGRVTKIDIPASEINVQLDKGNHTVLNSPVAYFSNRYHTTVHPLAGKTLSGNVMKLKTTDDLLIGRLRVDEVSKKHIKTSTNLPFELLYNGATLLDNNYKPQALIENSQKGIMQLSPESNVGMKPGSDAWLSNVGIGDQVLIKNSFSWELPAKKTK